MAKKNTGLLIWSIVTGAFTFGTVMYLKSGRGAANNASLIPDALEDRLDAVVEALNRRFGRQWVTQALDVLQEALAQTLPPALVDLIELVYVVEQQGVLRRLSGSQKRRMAMGELRAA